MPQAAHVEAKPPSEQSSDRSLLQRYQDGNQDAATLLYLRYAKRLRALIRAQASTDLARRVEVDDIVQSVFRSFFRGASNGYYDVPAGEELWKLFLVIALNKVRATGAYHRAAKRDVRLTVGGDAVERSLKDLQQQDGACAFLQLTVDEALERLPALHRRVVQFRIEGYDVAEIADLVGRSKRTVERTLQEVRERLRILLDEKASHGPGNDQNRRHGAG